MVCVVALPYDDIHLIADPLNGYLRITVPRVDGEVAEATVIDDPWVQRLKRIHQLQSSWWVFPTAEHSRFAHSLGAMHLAGEFGLGGQDRHPVIRHRQEPAADRGSDPPLVIDDLGYAALGQGAEHRRVPGQDADVALEGLGDHHAGLARPQLAVGHDQLHAQAHRSSPRAFCSTSSIPPTM